MSATQSWFGPSAANARSTRSSQTRTPGTRIVVLANRPTTGDWWVLKSSTNFTASAGYHWGLSGDIPVAADYDGDGAVDLATANVLSGAVTLLKRGLNQWMHVPLGRSTKCALC